jgi:hypothetical protein
MDINEEVTASKFHLLFVCMEFLNKKRIGSLDLSYLGYLY